MTRGEHVYLVICEAANLLKVQNVCDSICIEWALVHQIPDVLAKDEVFLEASFEAELVHESLSDTRALGREIL